MVYKYMLQPAAADTEIYVEKGKTFYEMKENFYYE